MDFVQGRGGRAANRRMAGRRRGPWQPAHCARHRHPTFESDGSYTSESGNHAAIYLYRRPGIWVYDQWQGQPVQKRLIPFEGGSGGKWGSKSNDGSASP